MTWKHEAEDTTDGVPCCYECWVIEYEVCTVPTLEPCMAVGENGATCGRDERDPLHHSWRAVPIGHDYVPPQPTRCTCGHPIKEAE